MVGRPIGAFWVFLTLCLGTTTLFAFIEPFWWRNKVSGRINGLWSYSFQNEYFLSVSITSSAYLIGIGSLILFVSGLISLPSILLPTTGHVLLTRIVQAFQIISVSVNGVGHVLLFLQLHYEYYQYRINNNNNNNTTNLDGMEGDPGGNREAVIKLFRTTQQVHPTHLERSLKQQPQLMWFQNGLIQIEWAYTLHLTSYFLSIFCPILAAFTQFPTSNSGSPFSSSSGRLLHRLDDYNHNEGVYCRRHGRRLRKNDRGRQTEREEAAEAEGEESDKQNRPLLQPPMTKEGDNQILQQQSQQNQQQQSFPKEFFI